MSTTAAGNSPRTDELKNSRYISLGLTAETATQWLSEGEALLTFLFSKTNNFIYQPIRSVKNMQRVRKGAI